MKRTSSVIMGLFFLVLAFGVKAQTPPADYFAGKWSILVEGVPGGDTKMIINLIRKEGKLGGAIQDSTQKEIAQITKVEENEKSISIYFTAQGYDVDLVMEKKDDDHIAGSMMNMFDAKGERIKEIKK